VSGLVAKWHGYVLSLLQELAREELDYLDELEPLPKPREQRQRFWKATRC
jgi:hypothetical protein